MLELTSHDAFEKCLVKNPIQLPSSTCVGDALQAMAKAHRFCELEGQQLAHLASNRSSCILVLEDSLLIGIVTERDLLQLVMQEEGWQALILDEVMSSPVITVELRKELTPLTISQSLQRHGIRHLPILTPTGEIHGVVTHRLLRHTIEAAHLLKLRFVSEVMVSSVVQAGEESSLLDIARLMYHNNIGSVVITRSHPELENEFMAVGLVTEQDILQSHALGLDLNQKPAIGSMSGSPQTIRMGDSLVLAKERMVQTRSDRLIVVGPSQEMVGLITQSNLIEAMNHNEMFRLVSFLEEQIQERTQELDSINKKLRREIQERRRAEERIRRLTLIDELTGLYNRRGFFLLAEQELKLAEQRSLSFSLFFADMDNLKVINDEMGHEMGDRAIIDVARHLRSSFRKADVIARLGGDEFVCFALTSDEEANLIAERLDRAIADFNLSQQHPYELSLSYGRVSYDDLHGLSLCDLVQEADVKMYEVKSRKKLALEKLK